MIPGLLLTGQKNFYTPNDLQPQCSIQQCIYVYLYKVNIIVWGYSGKSGLTILYISPTQTNESIFQNLYVPSQKLSMDIIQLLMYYQIIIIMVSLDLIHIGCDSLRDILIHISVSEVSLIALVAREIWLRKSRTSSHI